MKKIVFYFVLCCVISCNQTYITIEYIALSPILEIDQFSDSTFFSDIRFMFADNDLLYISDYTRSQVMVLDNNGILASTVSSKGQGPGDLLGSSALFIRNDTVYVFDEKRKISVFYKEQYLRAFDVPDGLDGSTNFALYGNNVIMTNFNQPHSLAFVDMYTDSVVHFGQMFNFHSPIKNRIRNHRYVCMQDSFIYAISDNQPVVERYDPQGNLVETYDYSKVEVVNRKLSYVQQKPDEEKSYYILVDDCYLQNEKLYLLLITMKDDKVQANTILEIDLSETMQAERLFYLGEDWFGSICCFSDCLWAFNITKSTLIKYKLP